MKVGPHGGESLEEILVRKQAELEGSPLGVAYWGYGGSVCHPTRQVQPLAHIAEGRVGVVFIETPSDPKIAPVRAQMISRDGAAWNELPYGHVTSSKWALVLSTLHVTSASIDLADYEVAVGSSKGRPLEKYLRGRCDKACAWRNPSERQPDVRRIVAIGQLADPWAVFLRG